MKALKPILASTVALVFSTTAAPPYKPGYSGADAAMIAANGTQHQIVWPKTKAASLPGGQQLAARVKLPAGRGSPTGGADPHGSLLPAPGCLGQAAEDPLGRRHVGRRWR
jgi:hypothetical protein